MKKTFQKFNMISLKSLIKENEERDAANAKIELLRQEILAEFPQIEDLFLFSGTRPDVIKLDQIKIKPEFRRKGIGSAVMDRIKKFADENNFIITLSQGPERGYKKKLDQFYRGHGFYHNKGRRKDYSLASFFGPNMIRRPLKEGEEEDIDQRELEDLQGKDAILTYLTSHGKTPEVIDLAGDEVIIWDEFIIDDVDYPWIKKKIDWIYSSTGNRLINAISDKLEEKRSKLFWEYPPTLYHATPKENIPSIQQNGLKAQHKSRSLTNRNISSAVFTTTEPDEIYNPAYSKGWSPGGPYGDSLFAINTKLMKVDGFMPSTSKEPAFAEQDAINFLAHKIKVWDREHDTVDSGDGTSDTTIIIHSSIPPKYVSLVEHD